MVFCYNIMGNWVDFRVEMTRNLLNIARIFLGKLMDFGLKLVKFRCLAARFFFVQHMKILRAARNFAIIFEVTARKNMGKT